MRGAYNFDRVAHGKIVDKFIILVFDHGQIIALARSWALSTGIDLLHLKKWLKTGRLVHTFTGDHKSYVSLSREKEDAVVDELVSVISAEDHRDHALECCAYLEQLYP